MFAVPFYDQYHYYIQMINGHWAQLEVGLKSLVATNAVWENASLSTMVMRQYLRGLLE
jgi:hypothetical protein